LAALAAAAAVLAARGREPLRTAASGIAAALAVGAVAEAAAAHGPRLAAVWAAAAAGIACVAALGVRRLVDRPALAGPTDAVAAVGAAGAAIALVSLGDWLVSLGAVAGALAVAGLVCAALLTDDRVALRWLACAVATVYAGVAAGAGLHLHGVDAPEWYVATPAVMWLDLGVVAMLRHRTVTSAVLLPALVVGLTPTLWLALDGDTARQAVLLVIGILLLAAGGWLRLGSPLYVGAVVVAVLTVRIVGPHVVALPRWLTLGGAGVVLLLLGATWERRLSDARRLAGRLRPGIAALR
jgi:hypothetical protein